MTVQGTLGTLTDTEIEAAFHARWDDVSRCLKEAQPHLNYLAGRVELKLRVDASGALRPRRTCRARRSVTTAPSSAC